METEEIMAGIALIVAIIALAGCAYVYTADDVGKEFDSSAIDANILFLQSRLSTLEGATAPTCMCEIDDDDLEKVEDDISDLKENIESCADDMDSLSDLEDFILCLRSL